MKNLPAILAAVIAIGASALAVETLSVGDSSAEDFAKGEMEETYVDEAGRVVLARETAEILTGVDHAWCSAAAPDGTIYVGTVPGGDVYRIIGDESEVFFETGEGGVFSLAVLPDSTVVAGTGPDGKVFRISHDGAGEAMADLEEPYVFALAVWKGMVLAATGGGEGRVYRLRAEPELLYDSPGAHILALATAGDRILAASGDNGSVYEISPDGSARVLFAAPQGVVQALAVADGTVFAGTAAIAEAKPGAEERAVRSIIGELQARQAEPPLTPTPPTPPAKREYKVTNSVYAIAPDGAVREIFKLEGGLILALAAEDGRILAGTAGKAGIYSLCPDGSDEARIYETDSEEIHSLCPLPAGGFAATLGMPGGALRFARERAGKGSFTGRVLSSDHLTRWGALRWEGRSPVGTKLAFDVRAGNSEKPDSTWTEWRTVAAEGGEGPSNLPPSRFVQYRLRLASASGQSPSVTRVSLSGLPVNLAPQVASITAGAAKSGNSNKGSNAKNEGDQAGAKELSRTTTVSWKAEDPNKDKLEFTLYFRDEGMPGFIKLEEDLSKPQFEWDTTTVPDGKYFFRVVASDAPSNPSGSDLEGSKVEGPFTIDNTGPELGRPEVSERNGTWVIAVTAVDAASPLKEAFYSIDGGEWRAVFPEDGIFDSPEESISLEVERNGAGIVMIRLSDRAGNTGAVRVILRNGE